MLPFVALLLMASGSAYPPDSLGTDLVASIGNGGSVAILPRKDGIWAVSADGARQKVIATNRATWLLVDNRADAIWFGRKGGGLWLIDLTAKPGSPPEEIAGFKGDEAVVVAYGPSHEDCLKVLRTEYDAHLVLDLSVTPPTLAYESGIYDDVFEKQGRAHARRLARIQWAPQAQERLVALAARGKGRPLLAPNPRPVPRLKSVSDETCESAEMCGNASRMGKTRFLAVLVEHSCGDACHTTWQLYDSRTKEFMDAADPKRRSRKPLTDEDVTDVDDAWTAPGGEGFVVRGSLYNFERGQVGKIRASGDGGGWLGLQWHLMN